MSNLSWVVVHGALLWQVALGVSLLGGIFFARFRSDLALRSRAARVREALGTAASSVNAQQRGTDVTLEGRLCGATDDAAGVAAVTVSPHGVELSEEVSTKAISASRGGAPLTMDVGGTRVVLDTVQIVVGSLETGRCVPPSKGKEFLWDFAAQLGVLPAKPFGVRSLSYGDRIRVSGRLRHEPDAAAPGGYRSGGAAYFLDVPEDAATKVLPLAFDGKPRALARGKGSAVLSALAVPLGVVALLGAVGEVTIRIHRPFSLTVASLTPFRRGDALGELRTDLHLNDRADSASVARAVHLDLLRGRCGDASEDWFDHGQPVAAAELAERCNDMVHAARAWFVAGEFERAAHSYQAARAADPRLPPTLSEATAYIAANMNERASAMVRALIPVWEGPQGSRERLACVADALDARNGSLDALRAHVKPGSHSEPCGILLADSLTGKEREEAIDSLLRSRDSWNSPSGIIEMLAIDGRVQSPYARRLNLKIPEVFVDPRDAITVPPALVEAALQALGDDASTESVMERVQLTYRKAAFESFLGDDAAALAEMRGLRADLEKRARHTYTDLQRRTWDEGVYQYDLEYTDIARDDRARILRGFDPDVDHAERAAEILLQSANYVSLLFATHAGDQAAPSWFTMTATGWQSGRPLAEQLLHIRETYDTATIEELGSGDTRESNRKLWELAAAGDGAGLTTRMRAHGLDGRGVVDRVAFQIPRGKDELKTWLRWSYPPPCATCGLYPLANNVASRHDTAVAIGDDEVARETRATALRLRALFLRRDTAVVLAMLSELSPP